ncbi:MAG: Glutamate synthase (NADPH), homotetrameric, partial [Atribacteria bacterium 34_128]
ALRLGAEKSYIVYRRSRKEVPARAEEVHHAEEEGIIFNFLTLPVKVLGDDKGNVIGMECLKMELGEPDDSGRRRPIPIPGSNFLIETDMVIDAIGTSANPIVARSASGVKINQWGYFIIDDNTKTTTKEGIFAGGDIVRGSATVISAVGDGKVAARALIKFVPNIPLMEIILFRNIPTMLIIPLILIKKGIPIFGNNRPFLLLRSMLATFSIVSYFYTIKVMILTNAVSIKQLSPLLSIFFAAIFLREKISFKQVSIFIFAFLGTLLVVKPGLRADMFPAIVGLGGAIMNAIGLTIVRHLRSNDHPLVIVNYLGYVIGLTALGVLLWQKNIIIPDIKSLIILVSIGLLGLGAQYTLTLSYHMAPPKLVSLCLYLTIVFSAIFDTFIFKKAFISCKIEEVLLTHPVVLLDVAVMSNVVTI